MNSSSYDQLDLLQVPFPAPSYQPKSTKFGSVLNDLSSFLKTAADSAVTVDGIINGPKTSASTVALTPQQQLALMQAARPGPSKMPAMLLAGAAVLVGGGVVVALVKRRKK